MGWYGQILDMARNTGNIKDLDYIKNLKAIDFLTWISREKAVNEYTNLAKK